MTKLTVSVRQSVAFTELKTAALIILVAEGNRLSSPITSLDKHLGGLISQTIQKKDFLPTPGAIHWLPGKNNIERLLLIGCGDLTNASPAQLQKICRSLAANLVVSKAKDAVVWLDSIAKKIKAAESLCEHLCFEAKIAHYKYEHTLNHRKKPARVLRKLCLMPGPICDLKTAKKAALVGGATGEGTNLTRELVNLPGNICTPSYLASVARRLARGDKRLSTSILDERKMKDLGMHSLLSVGNGSDEPSRLIILQYRGAKPTHNPYCLVGKGITFDTGGISLKPGSKMDEMKFDMGGAGSVIGALYAASLMNLPINVVGVIAAAENMPSGHATKPGDVVTSMSGRTIEILNTDAEGRLVLCDALTYVARFSPKEVVDIATLTGAIIVALGNEATGIFSNDDELANALIKAGERCHDRGWQFPIWDEYHKQLESNFADIANIGMGGGGSITAACFLSQFATDYKWAHLDIAGTAFKSSPKGATGRPVPLLLHYLRQRAGVL